MAKKPRNMEPTLVWVNTGKGFSGPHIQYPKLPERHRFTPIYEATKQQFALGRLKHITR